MLQIYRKDEVIHNIEQQGLLTNELKKLFLNKPNCNVSRIFIDLLNKKKTRATEAKRKGLESLAQWISDGQQGELSKKLRRILMMK